MTWGILEMLLRGDGKAASDFITSLTHEELGRIAAGLLLWRADGMLDALGQQKALRTLSQWRRELAEGVFVEDEW